MGVVGQLADYSANREVLSRSYEALPTVDRGWQVASAKDGTWVRPIDSRVKKRAAALCDPARCCLRENGPFWPS